MGCLRQASVSELTATRPVPHFHIVDDYVKAFYLPESDVRTPTPPAAYCANDGMALRCGHGHGGATQFVPLKKTGCSLVQRASGIHSPAGHRPRFVWSRHQHEEAGVHRPRPRYYACLSTCPCTCPCTCLYTCLYTCLFISLHIFLCTGTQRADPRNREHVDCDGHSRATLTNLRLVLAAKTV